MRKNHCHTAADLLAILFLKEEMERQGISLAELGQRCELRFRCIQNEMTAGVPSKRLRKRIEHELGVRAVWSAPAEVTFRQRAIDLFALDPSIATLKQLKEICQRLDIPGPALRKREACVTALAAWMAAHPNQQQAQSMRKK